MNEPGKLLDGQPVAIRASDKGEFLVSDGEREWWVKQEYVVRV